MAVDKTVPDYCTEQAVDDRDICKFWIFVASLHLLTKYLLIILQCDWRDTLLKQNFDWLNVNLEVNFKV